MTKIIQEISPNSINEAVALLTKGKLIVFCTDTVYGLAADAFNPDAIKSLYQIKERDMMKAIPIMIGNIYQLTKLVKTVDNRSSALVNKFWPGGLTVILPKKAGLPRELSQLPTIGIRMPDHPFCLDLLRIFGPLAVTSANLSGAEETLTAQDAYQQLSGRVPLIIDGGRSKGGIPSTIIDCASFPLRVFREGAIKLETIMDFLNKLV